MQGFGVYPALVGEGCGPFEGRDVASDVPGWGFAPVEEFAEGDADVFFGAAFEEGSGHGALVAAVADDGVVDGCVGAEAFGVDCRAGVNVGAFGEEEVEDFLFIEIDGEVKKGCAVDGRPMHAGPVFSAAEFGRINFAKGEMARD